MKETDMKGKDSKEGIRKGLIREKAEKYGRNTSLRTKILHGYLMLIALVFFLLIVLVVLFLKNYVKTSIYTTMENHNQQIEKSIEYYFDDIIKLSEYPYIDKEVLRILEKAQQDTDKNSITRLSDITHLNDLLYKHVFYMNKRIDSVWLVPENSLWKPAVVTRQNLNNHYDIKAQDWYQKVYEGNGAPFILGVHPDEGSQNEGQVVSAARSIMDPEDGKYLGMIVINTRVEDFVSLWYDVDIEKSIFALTDKNDHLIMKKGVPGAEEFEAYVQENGNLIKPERINTLKIGGEKYYLVASDVDCMEGRIYQMYSAEEAMSGFGLIFAGLILGTAAAGILLFFISYRISDSITKPVCQLVDSMQAVGGGNLQTQTGELGGELQILSTTFNQMVKKMDSMFRELSENEKQKREMELLALQAQINPHFMYNTLNSVRCVSEMQGADSVTSMLDAMISILHYTAEAEGEIVTVEKEVEFIKNYIKIINFRYFDRFSFSIRVQDGVSSFGTLRFILQPIVENAVLHGFDAEELNAVIEIKIGEKEQDLVIEVTDNGKGMSQEMSRAILETDYAERKGLNKIGIYNVNKRIKLSFGEEYGIQIASRPGCFTKVIIRMPKMTEAGDRI